MQRFVLGQNAETMQAVPNMLELVPKGVNKGSGMRKLLSDLELPVEVCNPVSLLSDPCYALAGLAPLTIHAMSYRRYGRLQPVLFTSDGLFHLSYSAMLASRFHAVNGDACCVSLAHSS